MITLSARALKWCSTSGSGSISKPPNKECSQGSRLFPSAFSLFVRSLFLAPNDLLIAMIFYVDETGHASDPHRNIVGIGGFVSGIKRWEAFSKQWDKSLIAMGVESPFHMADFASRSKQFSDWDESRRQDALGKLLSLIRNAHILPIGAIVSTADFNQLNRQSKEKFENNPYFAAFAACFSPYLLPVLRQEFDEWDDITFPSLIFAEQPEFKHKASVLWFNPFKATVWGFPFATVSHALPKAAPPLQAADIWAYEIGHFHQWENPSGKMPRYPFRYIVDCSSSLRLNPHHIPPFQYFDREKLEALANGIQAA